MNLINDFQQNTDFLNSEFQKLQMVYGGQQIPAGMLKKISNSIWSQYKTLNVLDKKKTKLKIKIEWAIFTMPHNWLWKMFHSRLWQLVKMELKAREEQKSQQDDESDVDNVQSQALCPMPSIPVDLEALSYPSTLIEDKK